MEGRQLSNWIKSYLEFMDNTETPAIFNQWCAISAIAAALDRNVYIDRGDERLYPNMYIVLTAPSGLFRKSTAINAATRILKEALPDLEYIAEKLTVQVLEIASHRCEKRRDKKCLYLPAEEFAVLLSSGKDPNLVAALTKLYNPEVSFVCETVGRGRVDLSNTYVNILGGTTPEWLKISLPKYSGEGGFLSRVQFIVPDMNLSRKCVPHPFLSEKEVALRKALCSDLALINTIKGEYPFAFTEVGEYYAKWYRKKFQSISSIANDTIGYYSRLAYQVIKTSICIAASKRMELQVTIPDLEEAIEINQEVEDHLPSLLIKLQSNVYGDANEKVLNYIKEAKVIAHSTLMKKCMYTMNFTAFKEIIQTLIEMGEVFEIEKPAKTRVVRYYMHKTEWENIEENERPG